MSSKALERAHTAGFVGMLILAVSMAWSTAGFSIGVVLVLLSGLFCLRRQSFTPLPPMLLPSVVWCAALIFGALRSPADLAWDEVRGFYPLFLVFAVAATLTNRRRAVLVASVFVCATAAAGAHALFVDLGLLAAEHTRFSGSVTILTYSATMGSAFLLAIILFCWSTSRFGSTLWFLCGMLHLEGIMMNGTRAALVAVVLGLCVLLIIARGRRLRLLLYLSPFLIVASFLVQGDFGARFLETGAELFDDGAEISQRRIMWDAATRMFIEHPLLGVGPGNFRAELDLMYLDGRMDGFPPVKPVHQQAHSSLLHVAATTGLSGLLPMLWWFVTLFWQLWRLPLRYRAENVVALTALALFLGFSLGDTSLRNSRVTTLMAACCGAGLVGIRLAQDSNIASTAKKDCAVTAGE